MFQLDTSQVSNENSSNTMINRMIDDILFQFIQDSADLIHLTSGSTMNTMLREPKPFWNKLKRWSAGKKFIMKVNHSLFKKKKCNLRNLTHKLLAHDLTCTEF